MGQLLVLTQAEALLKGEVSMCGQGVPDQHSSSVKRQQIPGKGLLISAMSVLLTQPVPAQQGHPN